jgi:hypothetical protein
MLRTGDDTPQGADGRHEQPKGIGAHNVFKRATMVLDYTIIGMAVTESNFHGPAIGIRLQNSMRGQRHIGTEERFQGFETSKSFFAGGFGAVGTVWPPDHHDP